MREMTWRLIGAAAFGLVLGSAAIAQEATPLRVRGTIEKVDGSTILVKTREGNDLAIKLADNVTVRGVARIPLSKVKIGSRVGVAAVPQAGGLPKALEVTLFPEDLKPPETHTPYDLAPQSTMTNGSVHETVVSKDGQTLTVKYKDGETKILVAPDTPVVTYEPGHKDELKPGAKIMIFRAMKAADGTVTADAVSVGRGGLTPPM